MDDARASCELQDESVKRMPTHAVIPHDLRFRAKIGKTRKKAKTTQWLLHLPSLAGCLFIRVQVGMLEESCYPWSCTSPQDWTPM
eukprot:6067597-Amphidinium_carterae.1